MSSLLDGSARRHCQSRISRKNGSTTALVGKSGRCNAVGRSLRLEPLEDRSLLSVVTVNTVSDVVVADDGLTSLREAVDYANATAGDDTIAFDASLAGQTITLTSGQLDLTDTTGKTTIVGLGSDQLTVSGNNASRVFHVGASAIADISGLTITQGSASGSNGGGGIFNEGTLTVSDSTLSNNSAENGGGIENWATLTLTGSTLSGNHAVTYHGGGISNGGTSTITECVFSGNLAERCGGGIENWGTLILTNSAISGNSAGAGGGISSPGTSTISGSTISENSAGYNGGGIYTGSFHGVLTITDSTISGNSAADSGGGISSEGGLSIANTIISGNSAVSHGGGICISSSWSVGATTITGSTIAENSVTGSGGGIYNGRDSTVTITGCVLSGNSADTGGGIGNSGKLTLSGATISNNSAQHGGGIYDADSGIGRKLTIAGSTISGNLAAGDGGGIYVSAFFNDAVTTITNSTIAGNSAASSGGGMYNNGTLTIADSTIAANSAGTGGGLYHVTDSWKPATLKNTIVADNSGSVASPDMSGTVTAKYCLIENTTGATFDSGSANNITGVAPLLGTLGNFGGPTQTIPLLAGSAAINAGSNALIPTGATTDQRGVARVLGGTVDMGAYEFLDPLVVTTTSDVDNAIDQWTTLREAIAYANSHAGNDTITFASSLAGATITLTAGQLELTDTTGITTITGLGSDQLTISGNNASRVFSIGRGVTAAISGLAVVQGNASSGYGGGIYSAGALTVTNTILSENSANCGGGI